MKLLSVWGQQLDQERPLTEYPRMQLRRDSYTCLNGIWEYQITEEKESVQENAWKKIVVPFALGSKLSGTEEQLQPRQILWYRKHFVYQPNEKRTILNFEAVDQVCSVYLNGLEVGRHQGGYAPFSMDVSAQIKVDNVLIVECRDDSDTGIFAYGKQKLEHGGIWYTPTSGIWQTVWLEDIGKNAIQDIKITPDCDGEQVLFQMAGDFEWMKVTVDALGMEPVGEVTIEKEFTLPLKSYHPWTPQDPFLYQVTVETQDDIVHSYFGMRKFSAGIDENGNTRFCLNDHPLFLSGLLDQGYSIDGGMTYPSEEAMVYELTRIKNMGFNMLRKHVKEECRRWYYLCDRMGILVMQDMPNGGGPYRSEAVSRPNANSRPIDDSQYELFGRTEERSRQIYMQELDRMLETLYNSVCIFAWVPFNEGWGQFDSEAVTAHIRQYDTTRLVDSASGWQDQGGGDFDSRHVYDRHFRLPKKRDRRILILSEFGGYAFLSKGHSEPQNLSGQKIFQDRLHLDRAVNDLYRQDILDQIAGGLAGCIYTQLSDIEDECNGLFTADRRVLKIDEWEMKKMNERCIRGAGR